jgi:hypothetical protein
MQTADCRADCWSLCGVQAEQQQLSPKPLTKMYGLILGGNFSTLLDLDLASLTVAEL